MRTRPLVGRKAWFGPRRLGWGLSPASPEGWAVTAVAIAAVICVAALTRHSWWITLVVVAALLCVVFLKGTSPGGPRAWEEYQAQRDQDRRD
jgi:hypothetical protein